MGDAVLLVDWLNLSINLKNQRRQSGADVARGIIQSVEDQCAQLKDIKLARAEFVAEYFSEPVKKAIKDSLLAQEHVTRTAKEQADLVLTIIAMDYLYRREGRPELFFLATGDQDFIPLIKRILLTGAQVRLIVASQAGLTPEYIRAVTLSHVPLEAISTDIAPVLPPIAHDRAPLLALALFKICMVGGVLGGDQARNAKTLEMWGVLPDGSEPEVEMNRIVGQFTRSERRRVAYPGYSGKRNSARFVRRTYLNFDLPHVLNSVLDADWILRRCSDNPLTIGALSRGRFANDEERRLEGILSSMKAVGWLGESADGRFTAHFENSIDGLMEPLARVISEVKNRAYRHQASGISDDELFDSLRSTPIGRARNPFKGKAAREAIKLARRVGVIDVLPADNDAFVYATIDQHPLVRRLDSILKATWSIFGSDTNLVIFEHDLLGRMRERDERLDSPIFGYDDSDRRQVLRIFKRARLIDLKDGKSAIERACRLKESAWARSLLH